MPFIDYIFAIVALIAAVLSARNTTNPKVKIAFTIGWSFFILGVLFHDNPYLFVLLHLGSIVLIVTHLKNIKNCKVKPKNQRNN